MILKVNATRMELSRLKKAYTIAVSGHRLLKDKRDEMMRQFLVMKKEAVELRTELEEELRVAGRHFAFASAAMGARPFKGALLGINKSYTIDTDTKSVMNVSIPSFEVAYEDFAHNKFEVKDMETGTKKIEAAAERLIKLAELEESIKKLASELEKTRRHVNSLEYVTIPNYSETMHYIRMRIEENARSNTARLIKVKDMIIEEKLK